VPRPTPSSAIRTARLRIAGRTIHARFSSSPPPPISSAAQEISRYQFPRSGLEAVYWRNGKSGRYRLYWSDAGVFDLDAIRGHVVCHVPPNARPASVEEVLRGPVCSFFLVEHGFEPLHSGAVLLGGRCLAFAGEPGAGKSSLIAYLARNGARFFADDVLPLRFSRNSVRAWPGLAQLRLAPPSLRALRWRGRTLSATRWKSTLEAQPARGAKSVARIYLLNRVAGRDALRVQELRPREAFVELVSHTRNIAETARARMHRQLQVCGWLANRVPVRRLIYPSGFGRLAAVRQAILQDLDS
jgi:hypothetical protein